MSLSEAVTEGTLLGGRLRYFQPQHGYRTGMEPVLLAAHVPAGPGEAVLEAGTGAGAGLLCLAARVPSIAGLGLELMPEMAALATANFAANGFGQLRAECADLLDWLPEAAFDHAFANPPWHDPDGTASPNRLRDAAKRARPGLLAAWAAAMARALRPRGTLSLILPAASLAEAMAALTSAKCAEISLWPLWKREGEPATLVIVTGVRLGRGGCKVFPGLTVHGAGSGYSQTVEEILKGVAGAPEPATQKS